MKKKNRPYTRSPYSKMEELLASPTEPLSAERQRHHLTRVYQGLAELETAADPCYEAWRVCTDAVNITETIIKMGLAEDESGLLRDAIWALAEAGQRKVERGQRLRLSGPGMHAVRAVLQSYAELIAALPARTMIRAHRETAKRMAQILRGVREPQDVVVEL